MRLHKNLEKLSLWPSLEVTEAKTLVLIGLARSKLCNMWPWMHSKMGHHDLVLRSLGSQSTWLALGLFYLSTTRLRKAKPSQNMHLVTAFDSLVNVSPWPSFEVTRGQLPGLVRSTRRLTLSRSGLFKFFIVTGTIFGHLFDRKASSNLYGNSCNIMLFLRL